MHIRVVVEFDGDGSEVIVTDFSGAIQEVYERLLVCNRFVLYRVVLLVMAENRL